MEEMQPSPDSMQTSSKMSERGGRANVVELESGSGKDTFFLDQVKHGLFTGSSRQIEFWLHERRQKVILASITISIGSGSRFRNAETLLMIHYKLNIWKKKLLWQGYRNAQGSIMPTRESL